MKFILSVLSVLFFIRLNAQSNLEVFLFDIETADNTFKISDGKNISNNEGYDSQPSFLDERYIVFASTRNGQTDIAKYDTRYGSKLWINFSESSEYTPLKIPNENAVSAVSLDKDGKQRLNSYSLSTGKSTELLQDLIVAYYTWFDESNIVSAVIEDKLLNLFVTNPKNGKSKKYATNVGRSFHKIPNSNLVSFISKENENQWQIKSLNPATGDIKTIANTIDGVEDICWLNNKTIVSSKENKLFKLTLQKDNNWKEISELSGIKSISRIIINSESTKLLIVADIGGEDKNNSKENPTKNDSSSQNSSNTPNAIEDIVQKQLDAYNARDINAFMAAYSKDIQLFNYPNELRSEGHNTMRESYSSFFEKVPDLHCKILERIVIGNKIIDHEFITANGNTFKAVAIYEVENGLISKVTFIQ